MSGRLVLQDEETWGEPKGERGAIAERADSCCRAAPGRATPVWVD
jgi:hypothetical protein